MKKRRGRRKEGLRDQSGWWSILGRLQSNRACRLRSGRRGLSAPCWGGGHRGITSPLPASVSPPKSGVVQGCLKTPVSTEPMVFSVHLCTSSQGCGRYSCVCSTSELTPSLPRTWRGSQEGGGEGSMGGRGELLVLALLVFFPIKSQ